MKSLLKSLIDQQSTYFDFPVAQTTAHVIERLRVQCTLTERKENAIYATIFIQRDNNLNRVHIVADILIVCFLGELTSQH